MIAHLLIRADASSKIGTGHVMRCLALAQAWQDAGGTAHFAAVNMPDGLADRLAAEGFMLHRLDVIPGSHDDAAQVAALAREIGAAWVVEDGYHFGTDYQRTIKQADLRLMAIDDYGHAGHYVADLVLNQNIYADAALYPSREPTTRLLLGTNYVLLRREFLRWHGWQRTTPDIARKILVTMGGGDPDNVTLKVIKALEQVQVDGLEVVIVVGTSNPHLLTLQAAVQRSPHAVRLEQNVTDMSALMAWADIAVSAAGSTCWELAFMGLPSLVVVLADNQKDVASRLDEEGISINLGLCATVPADKITGALQFLLSDESRCKTMSQKGRHWVDCDGVARILTHLRAAQLNLRRAEPQDCRPIWEWANDPAVRSSAFSSDIIPWENHQSWFDAKLAAPNTSFFIAMNSDGTPFGQIRFDWNEKAEAEIDVNVRADERRCGLGSALIRAGVNEMLVTTHVRVFHAFVKKENASSMRAFEKAGFCRIELSTVSGQAAWHLKLTRNDE